MKRTSLWIAAAISSVISGPLAAQQLDPAPVEKHRPGDYRGFHRAPIYGHDHYSHRYPRHHYVAPRYSHAPRYWAAPVYPYAYREPIRVYPPVYAYAYEPEPIYVERVVEVPRVMEVAPAYREPPEPRRAPRAEVPRYAQAVPPPRAPEPPRMERYTLSAQELFGFDQATLRGDQPKLDEIARALRDNVEIDGVMITGHTDRLGSDAYNLKLSQRRADAVKAYLVRAGIAANRLQAVGKGESQPVVQCAQKNQAELIRCLEPNRRVEVEQITIERRVR